MKKKPVKTSHALACPKCGGESTLVYTRGNSTTTFRRRECPTCGRFTTVERVAGSKPDQKYTGVTQMALSVTDLLHSLGMTVEDLRPSITIPSTGATPT